MGTICPCTRDRETNLPKVTMVFSSRVESRATTQSGLSDIEPKVVLRSDESILRLIGPPDLYYRRIGKAKSTTSFEFFKTVFIGTGQPCLMQVIPKTKQRNKTKFKNDLFEKLNKLDHPHILRMHEIVQDALNIYIISEDYEAGDVLEYVAMEGAMSERRAATAIYQVLSALAYAHSLGIVHGNVSAETVVVKNNPGPGMINIKITGFERTNLSLDKTQTQSESTEKDDIRNCGLVLAYMLTAVPPSVVGHGHNSFTHYSEAWSSFSPSLVKLISAMLSKRPDSRPTALECIAHPWTQEFSYKCAITSKPVRESLSQLRENENCASLREALMRFIITRVIQDSKIARLAEVFQSLDINGDGRISEDELLFSLKKVMPEDKAAEEAKRVMAKVDKDHSGTIDYSEFLLSSFTKEQLLSTDNLTTAFRSLDVDGSGTISIQELKRFFVLNSTKNLDVEWKKLIARFDSSGDGEIDYMEFQTMMLSIFDG